jgi:hypothetical protein
MATPASVVWSVASISVTKVSPSCGARRWRRLRAAEAWRSVPRGACRDRTRRCPRRASSPRRDRGRRCFAVGRGREIAAVDGGTAGGVGDEEAVADELGKEFQIRRLTAAGAGAGEFDERAQELRDDLSSPVLSVVRSGSGRARKKSQLARSAASRGACGAMSMALWRGWSCPSRDRLGRRACNRCNPRARPGGGSAGSGNRSDGTAWI